MMRDAAEEALVRPGANCWRVGEAERLAVIIDADAYFTALRRAMLNARRSILMIGWDFDARIRLGEPAEGDAGPEKLGDFVLWLARQRKGLHIRLLRWDTGAFLAMLRGRTWWTIMRWKAHPRITLKLDAKHPLTSSHHQKIVVIDDALAFCGGIDITAGRWDSREHLDDDPRRLGPDGQPQQPWHDATVACDGQAARILGDLARDRWQVACGERLEPIAPAASLWPDGLTPAFRTVRVAVSRTRPDIPEVETAHEIEQLYLDLIAGARKTIYAESQYFASRKIAQAIAARLTEEDPPEIVIINPTGAQGWLEPLAMDTARARLIEALRRIDRHGRFRVYHPMTEGGAPIYVHAKIMVVDDRFLRVGSSNMNNRSMRLDTECDVLLPAEREGDTGLRAQISQLRDDLLAEHLGCREDEVAAAIAEHGLIGAIERLRRAPGQGRTLKPYELPELSGLEQWLADNEILDPNGPDRIFEPLSQRSLFKGWRWPRRLRKRDR